MSICCLIGAEREREYKILLETDHFFVVPALGQMGIEGYVLLCTKEHSYGLASMDTSHDDELNHVIDRVRTKLAGMYGPNILNFEHVALLDEHKRPNSLDHGHMHFIPTDVDVIPLLDESLQPKQIGCFGSVRPIHQRGDASYYVIQRQDGTWYVAEQGHNLPSQFLKRTIALSTGNGTWDWRKHPDMGTYQRTLDVLKGKF